MGNMTYEWRRARSVRTTWVTAAGVSFAALAIALITSYAVTDMEGNKLTLPITELISQSLLNNPIVIVLVSSLGAMAFGHEYRYGTIRLTLTAFPKRGGVFWSKLILTLVLALVAVALAAAVVYGVLTAVQGTASDQEGMSMFTLAWHLLVFGITYAVLAFALTVITRSHPLGIVGPLLLFMIELILIPIVAGRYEWLKGAFPIAAQNQWFSGENMPAGPIVWGAWMVGLLAVGWVILKRRDA